MAETRRRALQTIATCAGTLLVGGPLAAAEQGKEESPTEDLMHEHGVLRRIMLIYEEDIRRVRSSETASLELFHRPSLLVRRFIQDYHEKDEENSLFPALRRASKDVALTELLTRQHEAGRKAVDVILRLSTPGHAGGAEARREIVSRAEAFIRMYRPHAAREDTVVYPDFSDTLSKRAKDAMGRRFEQEEEKRFGKDGFRKIVAEVAAIEKGLGLYDLAQFTPKG